MRATIRNVLVNTASLTSIVPAARWYAPGNVLDNPQKPFVVLRWLAPVPSSSPGRFLHQLQVQAHDTRGSYKRLEELLGSPDTDDGVYGALAHLEQHEGVDARITQVDYIGHSGDQEDLTYNTNMMFSSWRIVGVRL